MKNERMGGHDLDLTTRANFDLDGNMSTKNKLPQYLKANL